MESCCSVAISTSLQYAATIDYIAYDRLPPPNTHLWWSTMVKSCLVSWSRCHSGQSDACRFPLQWLHIPTCQREKQQVTENVHHDWQMGVSPTLLSCHRCCRLTVREQQCVGEGTWTRATVRVCMGWHGQGCVDKGEWVWGTCACQWVRHVIIVVGSMSEWTSMRACTDIIVCIQLCAWVHADAAGVMVRS